MTVKEIAISVGKDSSTVQRWIKKMDGKMQSIESKMQSSTSTHPADFSMEEVLAIIEIGMGKNAAGVYRANAKPVETMTLSDREIALITKIVSVTVSETIKALDNRITNIETSIEKRKALLPAPDIKPRDHINMMVREYVNKTGTPHGKAWSELYRHFGYRTNTNPSISAKNRDMSILDYIEAEGMIETLESVAMEIYK